VGCVGRQRFAHSHRPRSSPACRCWRGGGR
jgi:hypothetical protein